MKFKLTTIAISIFCCAGPAMAAPLGEHPAVLVKRQAGQESTQAASMKFYMHPAGLQLLAHAPAAPMSDAPRLAARAHAPAAN